MASASRVEVNHQKQSLIVSYEGGEEILQISDAERSLNLEDLAQQVSARSQCGLCAAALTEPLRELRVAGPAGPAGPPAPAATASVERGPGPGVQIWLRSLSGKTLGPYNTTSIRTVAQLKSKVFKDAQFPVAQQEIAQGDRLLPDAAEVVEIAAGLMEIELQLLLLSPSPCRVALRFRPRSRREAEAAPVWRAETQQAKVMLIEGAWHGRREAKKEHTFDAVFDEGASSEDVYRHLAAELPQRALEGIASTLLCYGASGTGKSFSLLGMENDGLIPRTSADLFEQCRELDTVIAVSFLSIVHEEFRDLLRPSSERLMLREVPGTGGGRTVLVPGASTHLAASAEELRSLLDAGLRQLAVDATAMELKLSEVTQIFTIHVARLGEYEAAATIQFVHMADSARSRETRPNRSVTGLMEIVTALARHESFIPYRNSKLTRWLQPALRGGALLRLLCTASPVEEEETLRTMLFAADARQVKNFPKALHLELPSEPEPQDAFALQLRSLQG